MNEERDDAEIPDICLPDLLLHTSNSQHVALVDGIKGSAITYPSLCERVKRFAAGLWSLGVRPGDVVGLLCCNSVEQVVSLLGIFYIRAIPAPINPIYTAYELKNYIKLTEARFFVLDSNVLSNLLKASEPFPELIQKLVIFSDESCPKPPFNDERISTYQHLVASNPMLQPPRVSIDVKKDVALLLFSSGTTGVAKGVKLSHHNLVFMVLTLARNFKPKQATTSQNVLLLFLPLFHIFGAMLGLLVPLHLRVKVIIFPRFIPEIVFSSIQHYKVNELMLVPSLMRLMSRDPSIKLKYDFSSVTTVFYGGNLCSKTDEEKFKSVYNVKYMLQGYGSTEVSLSVIFNFPDSPYKLGSAGKSFPHTQVIIKCPKTGMRLGANQSGEICVKGHQVMLGYLNNPEATKEAFDEDGWFHTGDLGYYDEDGFFYLVDRIKDLIKFSSFQVAPAEIENLIKTHPNVEEAIVVGIEDPRFEEIPKALVVKKAGCDVSREEIMNLVKANLSSFKHLRAGVEFVESLPKNSSGKLLRKVIKQEQNQKMKLKSKL